ncbi:autophagy-related protein 17 [Neohortaea acidophila]|uniref:Autophagy-related protein 17 n=1 Tax=Neohortaea acidophila TaxID=245834 RepID=A0A6A6PSI7_9PEZI|nr:autophagy-related protein 17 [Neohortaea acidophila]KAF2482845.1 autophagy-related protein 17 [Neohortaea acidophila]
MDYDSDDSDAQSASPPASPSASLHALPSVEQLVHHFAAAKRSLTSTQYIWRANELVTSSRTLLEEIGVLNARNAFVRRTVDGQLDTLEAVKNSISAVGEEIGEEFQRTIERLDVANDRLERTVNELRKTVVDNSLRNTSEGQGDDDERTLFDFIDDTNHTDLQTSLRALIDSFYDSRSELDESVEKLNGSLRTISNLITNENQSKLSPDIGTIYDEPPLSMSQIFRGIEDHAAEMATLLESLVKHYDLCVTALKHTEGGGAAAKKAVLQADETAVEDANVVEQSLYLKTAPEPISEQERSDMLRVLENDAQEVDDVAGEIKDRNLEQEGLYEQLTRHVKSARATDGRIRQVLVMLHEMKEVILPSHVHAVDTFKSSWQRIQATINSQTAELSSLSAFYDGFLTGYAKLLREVDRRREAERQTLKVVEKAKKDLNRLFDADRAMREEFMEETGNFLPQGIWDGLTEEGTKWEIREADRE